MTPIDRLYNMKFCRGRLAKAAFVIKRRPSVGPLENGCTLDKPVVLISADLELGWGWRYSKNGEDPNSMALKARENMPRLMNMFEKYEIPVTWAIVGHLFLHSCNRNSHSWMRRIPYFQNRNWVYSSGDWYDADPCTKWNNEPAWYAPDLVDMILQSSAKHEIGCHTFSHIDFSYENCPSDVAEDEITACIDAARRWGIGLKSFVFPGGTYGNYEILQRKGFRAYRKTLDYELCSPMFDDHGLLVLPASVELGDCHLGWSAEYFVKRYSKYITKTINHKTLCHFWFHPSLDSGYVRDVLPVLLELIADLRNKGDLVIDTMGGISDKLLQRSAAKS
ncbi:MAG: polysaccharide deacetylase family protein [candidate division WOR-3 bacterium]|nr:MAG: polysaccharide deacetylase family protein [candidate division WOR-3 bacterium]